MVTDPYLLVAVQLLDGISAAVLGVMVPLIIADLTRGTGHFNLAQGVVGTAIGHRRLAQHDARRIPERPLRQRSRVLGLAGIAALGFSPVWR